MYHVYFIKNKLNGKFYVGKSKEVNKRIKRHFYDLNRGLHHNINLQKDYTSEKDFEIELIKCDDEKTAIMLEESYLQTPNINMYNIAKNSIFGDVLSNHPNKSEIKSKISETLNKNYSNLSSEERKEKYGQKGEKNGMYGKKHTEESKKLMSEKNKGNSFSKGRVMPEEQRKKLSDLAKERVGDKNPFYGKEHSDETKKLIAEKNKGKKPPNMKIVVVGEDEYESLSEAGRHFGVKPATILNRIRSKNYPEYRYK